MSTSKEKEPQGKMAIMRSHSNSENFIIRELDKFIELFPEARVRYEYDELTPAHFIEILPGRIYHLDEDCLAWESDMIDRFMEKFPTELVGFISDDAAIELNNPSRTWTGTNYRPG